MTIQDVKQIKLADYLQSLGYTPVKQQGRNLWYKSPLREETDASFKVNTELEKWYDFGIGKGGNINQRRKTLVNGLGNAGRPGITKESAAAALAQMGLSSTVRGEALTLEQFARLSDLL